MSYAITYFGDGVYTFTNGVWKGIKVLIITTILKSNERKCIEKYKTRIVQKRERQEILDRSYVLQFTPFSFFRFGLQPVLHPSIHPPFPFVRGLQISVYRSNTLQFTHLFLFSFIWGMIAVWVEAMLIWHVQVSL